MDKKRKKELIEHYRQIKPEMGIFLICSKVNNKCLLQTAHNLKGAINSTRRRLESGFHAHKELQREWHNNGPDNFKIEVLEILEYDKDETKTDYSEELDLMLMMWEEKLLSEKKEFYTKK